MCEEYLDNIFNYLSINISASGKPIPAPAPTSGSSMKCTLVV